MAGDRVAAEIAKRAKALEKSVSEEEQRKRLAKVAVEMKPLARRAATADLGGDGAFSGWAKGSIPLEVAFKMHRTGAAVTVHRHGKSAGPWRVAEEGRNQGDAGGFAGPGINRSTGATARTKSGRVRKVRAVKARRWNGYTKGKDTWSDAVGLMEKKAPELMVKLNREATRRAFTRGG